MIGKTSDIISFNGMHDNDNETKGYGWKQCTMKYQIVNNVTLKNRINCCISIVQLLLLTWERKLVIRIFRKTHVSNLLVFKTNICI